MRPRLSAHRSGHQSVVAHLLGQQRGQEQRFIAIKVIIQVHHALAGHLSETLPRVYDHDLVKALAQRPVDEDGAGASAVR